MHAIYLAIREQLSAEQARELNAKYLENRRQNRKTTRLFWTLREWSQNAAAIARWSPQRTAERALRAVANWAKAQSDPADMLAALSGVEWRLGVWCACDMLQKSLRSIPAGTRARAKVLLSAAREFARDGKAIKQELVREFAYPAETPDQVITHSRVALRELVDGCRFAPGYSDHEGWLWTGEFVPTELAVVASHVVLPSGESGFDRVKIKAELARFASEIPRSVLTYSTLWWD